MAADAAVVDQRLAILIITDYEHKLIRKRILKRINGAINKTKTNFSEGLSRCGYRLWYSG